MTLGTDFPIGLDRILTGGADQTAGGGGRQAVGTLGPTGLKDFIALLAGHQGASEIHVIKPFTLLLGLIVLVMLSQNG